jgi:2-oxoglutarate ferredoxin oxidoreductase subunit delta
MMMRVREELMPRGVVIIDKDRCKGCGLCISACPHQVLAFSGELNRSGYTVVHMEQEEDCVGCAFCAQNCPDVAIEVYREKVLA